MPEESLGLGDIIAQCLIVLCGHE